MMIPQELVESIFGTARDNEGREASRVERTAIALHSDTMDYSADDIQVTPC